MHSRFFCIITIQGDKMKAFLTTVSLIFCAIFFSSCVFYESEPAPKLQKTQDWVWGARYYANTKDAVFYVDTEEEAIAFHQLLETAIPTRTASVNDSPTNVDEYFTLEIIKSGTHYNYYLYKRTRFFSLITQWYLEIPYYGVYKTPTESAQEIVRIYKMQN